jgi:rhodanese-related sulfurtransferase
VKNTLLVSRLLPFALALVVGCKNDPAQFDDAGLAGGDDAMAQDSRPDDSRPDDLRPDDSRPLGAEAGLERRDVLAQVPDASAETALDGLTLDLGSADAALAVDQSYDKAALADGLAADARSADLLDATPAADAAAGGVETGCTGWNSLVRLSPAELVDLMAKADPIVINVHTPYEGDIPGTDTSILYSNVDAIETYLHKDPCADLVLICKSGGMSQSAGNELVKRGYLRVRDLAGGMMAWQAAGYPLLKDGGT